MFQQCPQCMTLISVTKMTSPDERGMLHCTHCGTRFAYNGPELDSNINQHDSGSGHSREDASVPGQASVPDQTENPPDTHPQQTGREVTSEVSLATRLDLHDTIDSWQDSEPTDKSRSGMARFRGVASIVLCLVLAGQLVYFKRDTLARQPALRPALESMCSVLGCELHMQRDLSRIRIIGRDVRSHPSITNALSVSVTLDNSAAFKQPFPDLDLSFSDVRGRIVASRRFKPEEYLPNGLDPKQGMTPNTPVEGHLLIVDPGRQAVNFEFGFF